MFDYRTLKLQPQSYIDEQLKRTQSDVLYEAQISNTQAYLYFLLEHWSTPKPLMPFSVLKYNVNICDAYLKQNKEAKKLPLIVNMVFYNGKTPYSDSTDFKDILDAPRDLIEQIWGKPFTLIDASIVPDDIIHSYRRAGILTFFMKHIWQRDFLPFLKQAMPGLRELKQAGATGFVTSLLNYAMSKGEAGNAKAFVEAMKEGLSEERSGEIMTIAEQLIEQGRQEGRHEGEYSFLLHQVKRKFHHIPEAYRHKIAEADAATLLTWGERILDAKDLEDIFSD